jgi:hypothetical protein
MRTVSYVMDKICSQDSDWLRAGQPRGRSSSPGRVKNFLFSTLSRLAIGSIQPPIQWVLGAFSLGIKRTGLEADHSPPTSAEVKINMDVYIHSPIRLNGTVVKHRDNVPFFFFTFMPFPLVKVKPTL